ncbi:MAG TPA: carboxymuconolactone decarboxylase family protein [Spirochaetia bacterium]|nr:carboxymuconolactone decarboxylase family protein [Spirochaetia bacterium]
MPEQEMQGSPFLSTIARLDPAFMEQVRRTEALVYSDGALPRKFKLLVAMAFDATHGAVSGVKSLAAAAMKAGATKEEVAEVLRVAAYLGGAGSLYSASQGLKELFP